MDMVQIVHDDSGRFVHFIERVNSRLKPALGPAMIGPFDDKKLPAGPCPLCGEKMSAHAIEHTESDTILHCPAGVAVVPGSTERLSMLDMPMRRAGDGRQ
jgi:hypothetical protein